MVVNNYVVLWFKGKELNMVFGLQLSFSRFGSTVNFWVMEPIYKWVATYFVGYERLGVTLFIGKQFLYPSWVHLYKNTLFPCNNSKNGFGGHC